MPGTYLKLPNSTGGSTSVANTNLDGVRPKKKERRQQCMKAGMPQIYDTSYTYIDIF